MIYIVFLGSGGGGGGGRGLRYFIMTGHNKYTKVISWQSSPKKIFLGQIDKNF